MKGSPTKGLSDSAPLTITGWISKDISQSDANSSATNTITADLTVSGEVLAGTKLILRGFSNASLSPTFTGSGQILVSGGTYIDSEACWTGSSGTIVVSVMHKILAGAEFTFAFNITNPSSGQSAPTISIEATGPTVLPDEAMTSASGTNAPLLVTGFSLNSISQSSATPGAKNEIRVRFATYSPLHRSDLSRITISGLKGLTHSHSVQLLANGDHEAEFRRAFGSEAAFDQDTLSLQLLDDTKEGQIYDFSFELQNPSEGREAADVRIGSFGSYASDQSMLSAGGKQAPLVVAGFYAKDIGQSTCAQSAQNTILITLGTRVSLPKATKVTVSGLKGSVTADQRIGLVTLRAPNAGKPHFAPSAQWYRKTGTLIISVDEDTVPDGSYVVAISLRNPTVSQEGVEQVEISSTGAVPISVSLMRLGAGESHPLKVAGFSLRQLQLMVAAGVPNHSGAESLWHSTLVLSFSTNVGLRAGSSLVVQGLDFNRTQTTNGAKFWCWPSHVIHGQLLDHQNAALLSLVEDTEPNETYQCQGLSDFALTGIDQWVVTIRAENPEISPAPVAVSLDPCHHVADSQECQVLN
eukprot:CAMPEP_0184324904 /NCGR_PEP_ID=MMETSP1049-20130417/137486_1 /TAXON_ID=77928 /ORGANISM="Proteomonas sulcata, Strain CCMP704" /LENGTH=581 /DNA_ID=CAMNT_0026646801 /DNA_START=310 /DNA_END=2055 /DNA_ORIENTATION=+